MRRPTTTRTEFVGDEQQNQMLKIGDVAKPSGVGIEALRFYEKSGFLDKTVRTFSGYRMYPEEILDRLSFIKQAQTLGFSLDEIRRIIDDARAGKSPCDDVRQVVTQRLAEVKKRIEELKRYHKAIEATVKEWDEKGHAPGNICPLIESSYIEESIKPKKRIGRKRGDDQH